MWISLISATYPITHLSHNSIQCNLVYKHRCKQSEMKDSFRHVYTDWGYKDQL